MRAIVAVIVGGAALAGCESFHGLWRTAVLHAAPSLSCIESVLDQTPGVERVEVRSYVGAYRRPTTRFSYSYSRPDNNVLASEIVVEQEANRVVYRNTTLSLADNISKPDLAAARAMMIEVEQRLVHDCGLQELQSIAEQCKGASCRG